MRRLRLVPACGLAVLVAASALAQGPRPTAVAAPFALPCDVGQSATARHLARDGGGRLWAVAACSGSVQVTWSDDGGRAWGPVRDVSGTGVLQAAVEAGSRPGSAVVAWETFTNQVVARVTADGGATWSPAAVLMGLTLSTRGLSAVMRDDTVHVMAYSATLGSPLIASSTDAGATWSPAAAWPMPWAYGDLVRDDAAGQLELVADSPSFVRRTSADEAASFSPVTGLAGGCCLTYSDWALGGARLLAAVGSGSVAWRFDLAAGTSQSAAVAGSLPAQRSVAADAVGAAWTAAKEAAAGEVTLLRWGAADPAPGARLVLDAAGDNPSVAACDDGAAVLWRAADGRILVDRECLDGSQACCDADANRPPECDAGPPREAECAPRVVVALDGAASRDPDGDPLSFSWTSDCPGASFDDPFAAAPTLELDGTGACDLRCTATLVVSDGRLESACVAEIGVQDSVPPLVGAPGTAFLALWPPNHRVVTVAAGDLRPDVADACGGTVEWSLAGCLSSQPDDALGDGRTDDDCRVSADGLSLEIRAERQGMEPAGRTYAALVVARDACGNETGPVPGALVHVPRDRGRAD